MVVAPLARVPIQVPGTFVNSFCAIDAEPVTLVPDCVSWRVNVPGSSPSDEKFPCQLPARLSEGAVGEWPPQLDASSSNSKNPADLLNMGILILEKAGDHRCRSPAPGSFRQRRTCVRCRRVSNKSSGLTPAAAADV